MILKNSLVCRVTLYCSVKDAFHSWPGKSSRYSQWVVKVAAGGCKRLAASLQRSTSKNHLRLSDRPAESSAKEVMQRKRFRSERATAAKGSPQRKTQKAVKICKPERARKCVESSRKPESTWYFQEFSKYSRVSRCGLIARSCSRLNAGLIKFS